MEGVTPAQTFRIPEEAYSLPPPVDMAIPVAALQYAEWRVLVCGSRDWDNYELLVENLDSALDRYGPLHAKPVLMNGGARGADSHATAYARARGIECRVFHPDWKTYGRRAGLLRNEDMISQGPRLVVAFYKHRERSRGAAHTVKLAREAGIPYLEIFDEQ